MNLTLAVSAFVTLLALSPLSYATTRLVDDSDLSRPVRRGHQMTESVPTEMAPDEIQYEATNSGMTIEALRYDHGKLTPIAGLPLLTKRESQVTDRFGKLKPTACDNKPGTTEVSFELKNRYFSVGGLMKTYRIKFEARCEGTTRVIFKSDSNPGQALGIWQIAERARAKLESSVGLAFWRNRIGFNWPADGDYYSFGTVHITLGHQWDVVGHELGHAIYDQAKLGAFGGGEHKIDQCYSTQMAISEGWASFFSAWLSVDMSDPDAKFEYLVPRRAPIRFENIPVDVCAGESNEWRVTGFFWDLIDLHVDDESSNEAFAKIWNAMLGKRVSKTSDVLPLLDHAGIAPELTRLIWKLNFIN